MPPLSNLATRDVETLVHPYINLASFRENGPLIIERGQGVMVYDTDGKPYIEGMAGLWCTALGYGNEELVETAAAQMRKLSFAHLFTGKSHDPAIELAEKLKEIAPVPISKVFFCNSGSEANDTQVKLVWYLNNALGRPNKKKIISRIKAYHGVTLVAASLTGLPGNHRDFDLPLPGFLHAGCPHALSFRPGRRNRGAVCDAARRRTRRADRRGRSRHGRGLHRRAGDGCWRRDRAAEDLFRKNRGGVRKARCLSDRRRSDLRLRPAWHDVRLRDTRLSPAQPVDRQGDVVGLPADRRCHDPGKHVPGAACGEPQDRRVRSRLHLRRSSGFGRGRPQGDRYLSTRPHRRTRRRARTAVSGAARRACRPSAGRRGARAWADRRRRTRRRQKNQALVRRVSTASALGPWRSPRPRA